MEQIEKKVKSIVTLGQENKRLELTLHTSLSIFELGSNIRNYLHLHYEYIPKEELEVYSDTYFFPDYNIYLSVDEEVEEFIDDIRTDKSCIYQNKELIGMIYSDFNNLVKVSPDNIDYLYSYGPKKNGRNYNVYTYNSLGLMLWVWRNRIRTINIYNGNEMGN